MITYFRVLINEATGEAEHVIVSDAPLADFKALESTTPDVTGAEIEVIYREWNGLIDGRVPVNAKTLLAKFQKNKPADLKAAPKVHDEDLIRFGTFIHIEQYRKPVRDPKKWVDLDIKHLPAAAREQIDRRVGGLFNKNKDRRP